MIVPLGLLPADVDPNAQPQAEIKNGIVMITLPKAASAMPKKITVKTSKSNGEKKSKSN